MTNGQAMNEELEDEMMHRTEGALMAAGDDALLSADRKRKKLLLYTVTVICTAGSRRSYGGRR